MKTVRSKSIGGITDLVVVAPIKRGMIDAFENLTYESRLALVAEALHKIRVNAREHEDVTPFADTVERILTLLNFRIGVIDEDILQLDPEVSPFDTADMTDPAEPRPVQVAPRRFMFLTATFDGPLEPYLRLIWNPLGPFLDLLLCNCEGYKFATKTGFPEYLQWVRDHQVEPSIFYSTTELTVRDQIYLRQLEKLQRDGDPVAGTPISDESFAALTMESAERKALKVWDDKTQIGTALRLSFEALKVLYRLADYFPPDQPEGDILRIASRDLLRGLEERVDHVVNNHPEFRRLLTAFGVFHDAGIFSEQWKWFKSPPSEGDEVPIPEPDLVREEVQKGLLTAYDTVDTTVTNGIALVFSVRDHKLAAFAIRLLFMPTFEEGEGTKDHWFWPGRSDRNLAFTAPGLGRMGLDPAALEEFPREFVDGLFERAPMLGDVKSNHPRRWKFPLRRDLDMGAIDERQPAVHTQEIDIVWQLRMLSQRRRNDKDGSSSEFVDYDAQVRAIEDVIKNFGSGTLLENFSEMVAQSPLAQAGAELLGTAEDPFGSGRSEPTLEDLERKLSLLVRLLQAYAEAGGDGFPEELPKTDPIALRIVALVIAREWIGLRLLALESTYRRPEGEGKAERPNRDHFGFLDGVSQPRPDAPVGSTDHVPYGELLIGLMNSRGDSAGDLAQSAGSISLTFGSYMAMRKIAQFPERLDAVESAGPQDIAELIVGRRRDGTALIEPEGSDPNGFTYEADPEQQLCPFSSHIRLANPRDSFHGRPAPRILRRGMAYGKPYDPAEAGSDEIDRGTLFIAYNASLSEQYEVIQRWLNRGNSTDVSSVANDPLTGVMMERDGYTFRFRKSDAPHHSVGRVRLQKPLTEVQWGLYAFVPSRTAIEQICDLPHMPRVRNSQARGQDLAGEKTIQRISKLGDADQRLEWKRLIEDAIVKDPSGNDELSEVWTAIRANHGGVLRLENGIAFGGGASTKYEEMAAKQRAVLVAEWEAIQEVLSDPKRFSVSDQGKRTSQSFGEIFVAMDPKPGADYDPAQCRYAREAEATNRIVMEFGEKHASDVFDKAYELSKAQLELARRFADLLNKETEGELFFKIELRRDFLAPVLGALCKWLFDIPDASAKVPGVGYIEQGPWGWQTVDTAGNTTPGLNMRKPRCPADFMAPSRRCFYPRPTGGIMRYGNLHGKALRNASVEFVASKFSGAGHQFAGQLSAPMADAIAPYGNQQDLLARNIIGLMEGMLPPTDGIMRGIMYDWTDLDLLWDCQSRYRDQISKSGLNLDSARKALWKPVYNAMCKRPAPDLIYRTATTCTTLAGKPVIKGDLIVLALSAPMQASLDNDAPDIWPVFGGERVKALQPRGTPTHACPAQPIVMAMLYGMIAAIFDAGRLVVQPASLILRFSNWNVDPTGLSGSSGGNNGSERGDDKLFSPFI